MVLDEEDTDFYQASSIQIITESTFHVSLRPCRSCCGNDIVRIIFSAFLMLLNGFEEWKENPISM